MGGCLLAAVTKNGEILQFASEEMKNNEAIVLAAATQNTKALEFAHPRFLNEWDLILKLALTNKDTLRLFSQESQNKLRIILENMQKIKSFISVIDFSNAISFDTQTASEQLIRRMECFLLSG